MIDNCENYQLRAVVETATRTASYVEALTGHSGFNELLPPTSPELLTRVYGIPDIFVPEEAPMSSHLALPQIEDRVISKLTAERKDWLRQALLYSDILTRGEDFANECLFDGAAELQQPRFAELTKKDQISRLLYAHRKAGLTIADALGVSYSTFHRLMGTFNQIFGYPRYGASEGSAFSAEAWYAFTLFRSVMERPQYVACPSEAWQQSNRLSVLSAIMSGDREKMFSLGRELGYPLTPQVAMNAMPDSGMTSVVPDSLT